MGPIFLGPHQTPPSNYIPVPIACSAGVVMFDLYLRRDVYADVDDFDDNPEFKAWWHAEIVPGFRALAERMWNRLNTEKQQWMRDEQGVAA